MPALTPKQHDFYLENGHLIIEDALDDEDLQPVVDAMMETTESIAAQLMEDEKISSLMTEFPFETRLAKVFEAAGPDSGPAFGRSWRERKPEYFEILTNPKILDIAEAIVGPEVLAHPVFNTRPMIPGSPHVIVPWHQDCSYLDYDIVALQEIPAFWIPLVDVNTENGCLQVVPHSRNKGLVSYHQEDYSGTGFLEVDDEHLEDVQIDTCEMKKGSILLIDQMTFHRSQPNTSDTVRWSVDLRYQDARLPTGIENEPGLLVRSASRPESVATVDDFLANQIEHSA